ncbi:hypothetical protein [Ruegeria sp. ANG-S4]|uniref:hypothetical protein n=1 Tax=Ruegeria sp. ANG-S4 TaxID=1577904 RepID=UPI00068DD5EC|nr:hypothetical protein [Ruegeria sp. ANG-S4]
MLTQLELLRFVAAYHPTPPKTCQLEQKIQIGTGFHRKWYRSQREHWLGWLALKTRDERLQEPIGEVPAKLIWNRLKCSPMMFWLAEAAGADEGLLDRAAKRAVQAAQINPKDGNPHGKLMRQVLPWQSIEDLIRSGPSPAAYEDATKAGEQSLNRLLELRPEYKLKATDT